MKTPWTSEEIAELRHRYEAGETDAEIAASLSPLDKESGMTTAWTWELGTPRERADTIRAHSQSRLSVEQLCELFYLTPDGARAILRGDNWKPEYASSPSPPTPKETG